MSFLAPGRLWLLLLLPVLAGAYVLLQRRRRHYAVRFTNLELLASLAPRYPGWRRHVPAAAMALALAGLVVAMARPAAEVRVPKEEATVVLVVDTSLSMQATDVRPDRLQAAIDAAVDFVDDLPPGLRLGLVAFDRTARVLSPPTDDHRLVRDAIERLTTGPGTAAGEAIYAALESIALAAGDDRGEAEGEPTAAIVLLSDGDTTVGRSVELAAVDADRRGVPVTTIAFGTDEGVVDVGGQLVPVPADRQSMAAVAELTGGAYFEAVTGDELRGVYEDIGTRVGYDIELDEVGMEFVAVATVLLLGALGTALVWTGRLL